jgi:hypothetical protein
LEERDIVPPILYLSRRIQKVQRFKLVNTTVKKPKLHPKTGADLRTAIERVGHDVEVILNSGVPLRIEKHRPRIVDHLNEGMHRMETYGYIRIDPIEDVTQVLKNHVMVTKDSILKPDENVKYEEIMKPAEDRKEAKISMMGESSSEDVKKMESKNEGAVNPDGEPNFSVTASKDMKLNRKRAKDVIEEAPLDQTV